MDDEDRSMLTRVADYQWGRGAGAVLFGGDPEVTHTSSGRPRQVLADEGRLVTYATDGRFTLGVAGGRRLNDGLADGRYRVVVGDESEPYVREGRNAFAKFVTAAGPEIRPGDEVLVVDPTDALFAVGRAELSYAEALAFDSGVAVKVRHGVADEGA